MAAPANKDPTYSVSALVTYDACPFLYYALHVLRLPPPLTPGMRRGTSVHKLIADHLRGKEPALPEGEPEVSTLFRSFLHSRFNLQPVAIEKPFTLHLPHGRVRGRMDMVLPDADEGLEVVDIKSGAGAGVTPQDHLQLPIYTLAASALFQREATELRYTYYFLRDGVEHTFRPGPAGFEVLGTRLGALLQSIQAGHFAPTPGCTCFACRRLAQGRLRLPPAG